MDLQTLRKGTVTTDRTVGVTVPDDAGGRGGEQDAGDVEHRIGKVGGSGTADFGMSEMRNHGIGRHLLSGMDSSFFCSQGV